MKNTLESGIHIPLRLLIFDFFSQGYHLITDLKGYVYSFCQIFQSLRLIKGLRLFRTLRVQDQN